MDCVKAQQRKERSKWLLNEPISQVLLRLSAPMFPAIIAIMALDLYDALLVSRLGTESLAGLSFTIPITSSLFALAIGLSIGTASILSRSLGKGEHHKTKRITTDSLLITSFFGIAIGIIGWMTIKPLFILLGVNYALIPESFHLGPKPDILPLVTEYMQWRYLGFVFMLVPIMCNSVMRATGASLFAGRLMFYWAAFTALIDSYLMLVVDGTPSLASIGLGHFIADICFSFVGVIFLLKHEKLIELKPPRMTELYSSCREIVRVGLPAAGMSLLVPIALVIVTSWVAFYGREPIAAFGVVLRIESLALFVPMVLSTTLPIFVGQNFAAGCITRTWDAIKICIQITLISQLVIYLLLLLSADWLASLFSDSLAVKTMITDLLWYLPFSYLGLGVVILAISTLNAMHLAKSALLLNGLRMFGLFVPAAYFGIYWGGLNGLFVGVTSANLLIGLVAFLWLRNLFKAKPTSGVCTNENQSLV